MTTPPKTDRLRPTRLVHTFEFRLGVTLVVTLAAIGVVGYVASARAVEANVRAETLDGMQRLGETMADTYNAHETPELGLMMARAVMDGMARDPATADVVLYEPDGEAALVADPDADHHDMDVGTGSDASEGSHHAAGTAADEASLPVIARVAADGRPVMTSGSEHAAYEFWVPVTLGDVTHVLHVGRSTAAVDGRLAEARTQSLLLLLLGLPIAGLVFVVTGGWSLVHRHRRAVDGSTRDPLTGLGNHRAFQEDLRRAMARTDRMAQPLVCAVIDVDNFKVLNDRAGHAYGDEVLVTVATALAGTRAGDGAYRVGGDEFAVLLEPATAEEAAVMFGRVRGELADHLPNVTISIGVAQTGTGTNADDDLLAHADAALYEAKHSGRDRVVVFHDMILEAQTVGPGAKRALERILAADDVDIALQPILALDGRRPIGYEALARFPDESFAGPAEVFAVAHGLGRVIELDAMCRRSALRLGSTLDPSTSLFVNVSPEAFLAGADLATTLVDEAVAAGVDPRRVVIEVTEQRVIDPVSLVDAIGALRAAGFRVALDDVGAGNAGLELLRLVELDLVKIDRSVVVGAVSPGPARGVLLAILAFAQESGCYVVAEGVESDDLLSFVDSVRIDGVAAAPPRIHAAQGYRLGRPQLQPRPVHAGATPGA